MGKKFITYKNIALRIMVVSTLISMVLALGYGWFIKKEAIGQLAEVDAKKTSRLVFESLYAAMNKGWNKDDLRQIIRRLNMVDPDMKISVVRSEHVAELFGEVEADREARKNDRLIREAMAGKEQIVPMGQETIRYLYPVTAKAECLKCHVNAKEGMVNGVIDIEYQVSNLKVPVSTMLNSFIAFFILFVVVVYILLFFTLDRRLIRPIEGFVGSIREIMQRGDKEGRISLHTDIYELKNMEESFNGLFTSLSSQLYTDPLTGLPNRLSLTRDLRKRDKATLVLFNIDSFKEINDFYGHETGDEMLIAIAGTIRSLLPSDRFELYKMAADEYAVLVDGGVEREAVTRWAREVSGEVGRYSYVLGDWEIHVQVSCGVARTAQSGKGAELISAADIALKTAKATRKPIVEYSEKLETRKLYEHNIHWAKTLKVAIEEARITLYYQPIVNNANGSVEKYECLVRLQDERDNLVGPYQFLEVAKRSRLYPHITRTVVEKSFEMFRELPYEFSINLSVDDILNDETTELILDKLEESGIGNRVVFELLESEGIENKEQVIKFIDEVKAYGAKIAIDDFGTGYSNFEYLLKLRVDYIKIDASMIKNIDTDENSRIITETIVAFARKLKMKTIAEFVHSAEVLGIVTDIGVDYSQGFYLGEPGAEPRG